MVRLNKADLWHFTDFEQDFIETKLEVIIKNLILRTKLMMTAVSFSNMILTWMLARLLDVFNTTADLLLFFHSD